VRGPQIGRAQLRPCLLRDTTYLGSPGPPGIVAVPSAGRRGARTVQPRRSIAPGHAARRLPARRTVAPPPERRARRRSVDKAARCRPRRRPCGRPRSAGRGFCPAGRAQYRKARLSMMQRTNSPRIWGTGATLPSEPYDVGASSACPFASHDAISTAILASTINRNESGSRVPARRMPQPHGVPDPSGSPPVCAITPDVIASERPRGRCLNLRTFRSRRHPRRPGITLIVRRSGTVA